jgi:stage V sporulation protein SpoVS
MVAHEDVKVLKISGSSPTKETAGSIIKTYESGHHNIELRAIGASSVNQMFKAMATASSIFATKGKVLSCRPGYDTADIDGDKTVMIARIIID